MQSVIAGYSSREQAEAAVRKLERSVSIQDIVIADTKNARWRKLHAAGDVVPSDGQMNFLVVMIGASEAIDRARQLMQSRDRS